MSAFTKSFQNIRRTPYQSIAAVLVLTISFFIAIAISFITLSLNQALSYFESRPPVMVFFETTAQEADILDLKARLEQKSEVRQVLYIPQEEALEIYQDMNKNDPLLLELVTADILPASLEVSANSIQALEPLKSQLESVESVDEVVLRTDVIQTLEKWLKGIQLAGGIFIGIMSFTSVLIIFIVVGMKITQKHTEIRVLRLIGADSFYIQAPYLIEGGFYGLISSTLAYLIALSIFLYASPLILAFGGEVPLLPQSWQVFGSIYLVAVLIGLFVGMIGSFISVKRHLKL